MISTSVVGALRSIAQENDGLLRAEDVVKAARPPASPLHSRFEWEDGKAAREFRLEQARKLIRTTVEYIQVEGRAKEIRVFCALTPDRIAEGGGYREMTAVMKNHRWREQLLADARAEMKAFQARYSRLRELESVIREMGKVLTAEKDGSRVVKSA